MSFEQSMKIPGSVAADIHQTSKQYAQTDRTHNYLLVLFVGALLIGLGCFLANTHEFSAKYHSFNPIYLLAVGGSVISVYAIHKIMENHGYRNTTQMTALLGVTFLLGCLACFATTPHITGNVPFTDISIHDTLIYGACGVGGLIFLTAMIKLAVDAKKTSNLRGAFIAKDGVETMLRHHPELLHERHNLTFDDATFVNATLLELALARVATDKDKTSRDLVNTILILDQVQGSQLTTEQNAIGVSPKEMVEAINQPELTTIWQTHQAVK